jgi:sugar phosphate isomerase/epimerase
MKKQITRRGFLGGAAAIAAVSAIPFSSCASVDDYAEKNALKTPDGKPNSKFNGVQIGAITYSFRSMVSNWDEVINACVAAGLSSIELYHVYETELGAPVNPVVRQRGDQTPLTPEEETARAKYQADLDAFRKDPATMDKWAAMGKKFNDAGIDIHLFKWTAGNTDELLDYSFAAAKAMGAKGICTEISEDACKLLGPAAERNGMYAVFHQHAQFSQMGTDEIDRLLAISPANRLNWDCGHYYGYGWENSTKLDLIQFLDRYVDKIFTIHLKDKTSSTNETAQGANQVWGQGETPLRPFLQHIRDNYPHLYLDIELEYQIAPWSDAVKETAKCIRYAREILI